MTTTIDTPTATEMADVADKAADVVSGNGFHKGYLYDEQQAKTGLPLKRCRVDAVGAVNVAVFDQPVWPADEHEGSPLAQAVVDELAKTVGGPVPGWSDADGRTGDDVAAALRKTAASLRGEAA